MDGQIIHEVLWTNSAKASFDQIVSYLAKEWTDKEVAKFINRTTEVIATLKRYPEMCRPSSKRKNVRIAILNKHTQLIYHYKSTKKQSVVLLFWSMKKDRSKLKY